MFRTALHCLKMSACVLLLAGPEAVSGQSDDSLRDLVRANQNFEDAKSANNAKDAFRYGDEALKLIEASGDDRARVELLRSLGDFAAQSGDDLRAERYYERALSLQETTLGRDHPDLVPVLTSLVELNRKAKRYPAAAGYQRRILDIERETYGEHHENVLATLKKLRDIDADANDTAGVAQVDIQIKAFASPPVAERGLPPSPARGLPPPPGAAASLQRYKQDHGFATVRVFYGTNRAVTGNLKPAFFYGAARGELQYGYLDVTIPQTHKSAELETKPRWAEYTLGLDEASMRRRYVLLDEITPLPQDAFVKALRQQIKDSPSKDLFIFVHGFDNTFEDAARRAAQLAYDLDFDGTPMLYSWPSQGSATAYPVDEAVIDISAWKMADFLDTIVTQSGAERIHLLAHSMGNRALLQALGHFLAKRAPEKRQHMFGQIVFTAPDVDRDEFTAAIDSLRGSADRVTLYASDNDYALRTSKIVHGAPRAGNAGDSIIKLPGLDTIDMSQVGGDAMGHSYYAANSGAINDIFRILWRGDPPPLRCGMSNRAGSGTLTVWSFNADDCKGEELLEAGVILKKFGDVARDRVMTYRSTLTDPSQKEQWSLILRKLDTLLAATRAAPGSAAK